jgi:hypothetical protein
LKRFRATLAIVEPSAAPPLYLLYLVEPGAMVSKGAAERWLPAELKFLLNNYWVSLPIERLKAC